MPRPRSKVPSYRLHSQSGQAVMTVRTATGGRRDILLGKHGSPESKVEYERQLALLRLETLTKMARRMRPLSSSR